MTTINAAQLTVTKDDDRESVFVGEASDFGINSFPQRLTVNVEGHPMPYVAEHAERREGELLFVRYAPVNHLLPTVLLFND